MFLTALVVLFFVALVVGMTPFLLFPILLILFGAMVAVAIGVIRRLGARDSSDAVNSPSTRSASYEPDTDPAHRPSTR